MTVEFPDGFPTPMMSWQMFYRYDTTDMAWVRTDTVEKMSPAMELRVTGDTHIEGDTVMYDLGDGRSCDPCRFCAQTLTWYDLENGREDFKCTEDTGWNGHGHSPCPYFRPVLPSEGLYEQLKDEAEAEFRSKYSA